MLTRKNTVCQDSHVNLRTEQEEDVYFIVPKGEMVGGHGDDGLRIELDRLRSEGKKKVVVDFSDVPFIDSSILGQLVTGMNALKALGGDLKLLSPSKRVLDLLSLTRLIDVFEIYHTREEVLNSWRVSNASIPQKEG